MRLLQRSYCKCHLKKGLGCPRSVIKLFTFGLSGIKRTIATFQRQCFYMSILSVVRMKEGMATPTFPAKCLPCVWKVEKAEAEPCLN